MKNLIFCKYLKYKNLKQKFKIYPGKLGTFLYKNISEKAWNIWISKQILIINKRNLNLFNIENRYFLENEMIIFFKIKKWKE